MLGLERHECDAAVETCMQAIDGSSPRPKKSLEDIPALQHGTAVGGWGHWQIDQHALEKQTVLQWKTRPLWLTCCTTCSVDTPYVPWQSDDTVSWQAGCGSIVFKNMYHVNSLVEWLPTWLRTSRAARVRFPKSEIWRFTFSLFNLRILNPCGWSLCDMECQTYEECCDIAWVPHQVRKCKKSGDHTCATIQSGGTIQSGWQDERPGMTTERWGERVKCRMKCFYENLSHGPQDRDFDGIWRIHISRFLTSRIEPEPRGSHSSR